MMNRKGNSFGGIFCLLFYCFLSYYLFISPRFEIIFINIIIYFSCFNLTKLYKSFFLLYFFFFLRFNYFFNFFIILGFNLNFFHLTFFFFFNFNNFFNFFRFFRYFIYFLLPKTNFRHFQLLLFGFELCFLLNWFQFLFEYCFLLFCLD